MDSLNTPEVLYKAILACRRGRDVLLKYFGHLERVEEKFQAGLVSEADKESEKVIQAELRKYFPDMDFLGEESAYASKTKVRDIANDKPRWILDPLDGTTNYIHRFPVFAISLGLEYKGQMQVAVIDVPMMNETYTAVRGQGAWLNGNKIRVSPNKELRQCMLATGFFGENELSLEEQMKIFSKLVRGSRGIRRAGAAAYDLCQVAKGVFDAFWESNLSPWDTAAGILLVEEAGGQVTTFRGKSYDPYKNSIIASNGLIHQTLVESMSGLLLQDTN
jgi:myo-inositol-1(or 4)-monophosphatase